MGETVDIGSGSGVSATVSAVGGELVSFRDSEGRELLWQAGPEWPRHAPVLFPIVGRLAGDQLHHAGKSYPIGQHGFVRDRTFAWSRRLPDEVALGLEDDAESRAHYPFAFSLEMIYRTDGQTLSVTTRVGNPGNTVLPCAVGAHPGFRWPLVDGIAKDAHVVEFATAEIGSALSVEDGLLGAPKPLPFDGRVLNLSEELFRNDALVMPDLQSRSVRFVARDVAGRSLRTLCVDWEGYKDLGLWSKPSGAPFLCIEPWYGMASPVGWDGDIMDKPGILLLQPGEARDLIWRVTVEDGAIETTGG